MLLQVRFKLERSNTSDGFPHRERIEKMKSTIDAWESIHKKSAGRSEAAPTFIFTRARPFVFFSPSFRY